MRLDRLQRQIERLYEVSPGHAVEDFLLTDAEAARRLCARSDPREAPEKLLVAVDEQGVSVSLFIDREVLERLAGDDPLDSLHDRNLADFLTVVEGVSHFVYLTWNAVHARGVSLLELELQAEIDKFVVAALLIARQQRGCLPRALARRLFDEASFDDALGPEERRRYAQANHYARRYCRHLEQRYPGEFVGRAMVADLRRFYRYTQPQKLRHIEALA